MRIEDAPAGRALDQMVAEKAMGLTVAPNRGLAIHVEGEWSVYPASRAKPEEVEGWACYAALEPLMVSNCICANGPALFTLEGPDWDQEQIKRLNVDAQTEWQQDREYFGHSHFCLEVVPRYSEDIAAAFQVVDTIVPIIHAQGVGTFTIKAYRSPQYSGARWTVQSNYDGYNGQHEPIWWVSADTLPLAICRAALLAVGVRDL